ncbi:DUF402 domain-containing protein [Corynebacterium sp. CCM 8835]|uniref:DUF402 domain-containing protein n=1 Tax=Corynebacterium antarcticum TaxID=2800405 RepID=A0A9Q4CCU3_9CORY|nr:DUF402 domain-containing protein [Corynebacterium antarcticum]MCK7642912.1 DUF402 domain-containing protein [Corynebacterium antarcticum]MCK7661415.1 DUF402 domain-containing protein [Corynebacterium antarcticum]MCL0246152.1 DUF402 domain-containing protein [Corynebacterium antarcticum]MCX7492401.1 DUF402 domain-containing protein [Corynebacterium antarcticum]MCX7538486.1 DUF402 domain-containing protein [Corynebacterium antarcticum]
MTDLHPVKHESFDIDGGTNTDPKGFIREVDTYRSTDFGLYMARGANHPRFGYLETWLLPGLGLRVNIFHFRDGVDVHQDFYVDVAEITVGTDGTWRTRDLYVDLVSVTGEPVEVMDIDELAAATSAGLISAEDAETAIDTTLLAVEGITRNNDDLMAWLRKKGIELDWADPATVTLTPPE